MTHVITSFRIKILSIMTHGITTFSLMLFSIMAPSITTFGITTLSIKTFCIISSFVTQSMTEYDSQYNIMLSVVNDVMLKVIKLSVTMLNAIMLSFVISFSLVMYLKNAISQQTNNLKIE